MTTIIRVKRHIGEDPVEALVLACKRKKTEDDLKTSEAESFEKVLNFSGTVEEKDDKVATNTVKSYSKESKFADLGNKQHVPDIKQKQRNEIRQRSEHNRFKLLSCLRSTNGFDTINTEGEDDSGGKVTIVDVSREKDDKTDSGPSESSYVYDLYSTHFKNEADFNDLYMENLLSVQPLEYELEYRNGEDSFEEIDPDEDDSNDENNWRNDYPDSDSDMDEEDNEGNHLAKMFKGFLLDNDPDQDYELSSDSGEDKYLNYSDEEKYYFREAEDLGGRRYARYKANAMREMMDEDEDEDSINYSREDISYNSQSD